MSGVAVVRSICANAAGVTALVQSSNIMAGNLPLNSVMPALSIQTISSVPRIHIAVNESPRLWVERVQVSALAKDTTAASGYSTAKAIILAVIAACTTRFGTVNSVAVQSIVPDSMGPDLSSPDISLYSSSVDLIVSWSA